MVLFQKTKESRNCERVRLFCCRLQVNLCFKVAWSPEIPLTIELGLGLITISYEIYQLTKKK